MRTITFRAELKSTLSDFLSDAGMTCPHTEEALVATAVTLADYREEGVALYPRLLICDDLAEVLGVVQGEAPLRLGTGPRGSDAMLRALKKCAPLATGGWAVWIRRTAEDFEFGVFREPLAPTGIDVRRTLSDLPAGSIRALLVAQVAPGTVEVMSPGGVAVQIQMSGVRNDQVSTTDDQDQLAAWFVQDVADAQLREASSSFARAVLHEMLRRSHGTLIAVLDGDDDLPPQLAIDAVLLPEPADLVWLIDLNSRDGSSASLSELLAYSNLLGGMLRSDGIVVLDGRGRVHAFNCFVQTDTADLQPRDLMGGARHRAYAVLRWLVDQGSLRGVYLQSSDGSTKTYGKNNG